MNPKDALDMIQTLMTIVLCAPLAVIALMALVKWWEVRHLYGGKGGNFRPAARGRGMKGGAGWKAERRERSGF